MICRQNTTRDAASTSPAKYTSPPDFARSAKNLHGSKPAGSNPATGCPMPTKALQRSHFGAVKLHAKSNAQKMRVRKQQPSKSNQMLHYAICFVMRSGSNWLCDLLKRAGLGVPAEYYFPLSFAERSSRHEFPANPHFHPSTKTPADYWRNIEQSQGQVVGLKLGWQSFEVLQSEVEISDLDLKYLYLTRRDKLRQAISWYRAGCTKRWTVFNQAKSAEPPFNLAEIDKHLGYIAEHEQHWETYLNGKQHLRLEYESMSLETIDEIASFLGLEIGNRPTTSYQILRDDLTEEFVRRYRNSKKQFTDGSQSSDDGCTE